MVQVLFFVVHLERLVTVLLSTTCWFLCDELLKTSFRSSSLNLINLSLSIKNWWNTELNAFRRSMLTAKKSPSYPHVYGSIRQTKGEQLVLIFSRGGQIAEDSEVFPMTGINDFAYANLFHTFPINFSLLYGFCN